MFDLFYTHFRVLVSVITMCDGELFVANLTRVRITYVTQLWIYHLGSFKKGLPLSVGTTTPRVKILGCKT